MKDVPTRLPAGLEILAIPEREDPRDVLITRNKVSLERLVPGSRIGTSSLRRQAQLLHYRPDLSIQILRANLDNRLRKLGADRHLDAERAHCRGGWASPGARFGPRPPARCASARRRAGGTVARARG